MDDDGGGGGGIGCLLSTTVGMPGGLLCSSVVTCTSGSYKWVENHVYVLCWIVRFFQVETEVFLADVVV